MGSDECKLGGLHHARAMPSFLCKQAPGRGVTGSVMCNAPGNLPGRTFKVRKADLIGADAARKSGIGFA
ncbi:hypothetical protein [Herminiimonas sp.]|uniref:hypothetical protein n=1 Tax=Herminiimonas sp. TaxID=1926289 RepID=UPI00272A057F|nr:hypothetical protein [Herminiimonas sp.]